MAAPAILIACDKFKGTLTAAEACLAIARGLRQIWPAALITSRPMADGGEGTARVICDASDGAWITSDVAGPLNDRVSAGWAWLEDTQTAIIEMSEASGLKWLPPERRNPWRATTAGTGELMRAAIEKGARRVIVGLGGSATNDGGAGMAWAMGWRFLDDSGKQILPHPANLASLGHIVPPGERTLPAVAAVCNRRQGHLAHPDQGTVPTVVAACDVTNPLLGPDGATRVYGPQKGIRLERMEAFESALARLAEVAHRDLGVDFSAAPGAGAAGGLGFGLMTFCQATVQHGFDLVAEVTELEAAVRSAGLVITGEGCLDAQTLHGKGPARVADMARRMGKPVVAVGGIIEESARPALAGKFHVLLPAATRDNLTAALLDPAGTLERAVAGARELFEAVL